MNFSEKYALLISFPEKKIKFNFIKLKENVDIQQDYLKFTKEEKQVFNLIQNSIKWKEQIEPDEILEKIEKISFKLLIKEREVSEIIFSKEKLKLDFLIKEKNLNFPEKKGDFIFRLKNQKIQNFFLSHKAIYVFEANKLIKIETEKKEILNIIKRIFLKKYSQNKDIFSQFFQTSLSEKEIIKINEILDEFQKIFHFEKKQISNFQLIEEKKSLEEIDIFYDFEKNILEIFPILNYGVKKIRISNSVFLSKTKNGGKFIRKSNAEVGENFLIKIEKNKIFWNKINSKKEIEFYKNIFAFKNELGFNTKLEIKKNTKKQIEIFLEKNWKHFNSLKYKKVFLKNKLDFKEVKFNAKIDLNYEKDKKNILNFKASVFLNGEEISIDKIKEFQNKKDNFILDKKGEILKIKNPQEIKRLLKILQKFKLQKKNNTYTGKLYQITELENIFSNSEFYTKQTNAGYKKFLNEAKNFQKYQDIKIPEKKLKLLRPYQIKGVQWLSFLKKYNFGGILADDMGLGKTIQTLIFLSLNKNKKPSIVIAPKTLLENWNYETRKFTPELKTIIIDGNLSEREKKIKKIKNYDLIFTSYSIFQRDWEIYKEQGIKFNYAILDEAQYIKNFKTKNALVVKEIDSEYRLALSGTPMENSIAELWSIFEFLMPNFFGSFSDFSKNYINPIQKQNKEKIQELQKKISFFMLRRVKQDVLKELPEKIEQKIFVQFTPEQDLLYQEILNEIKKDFSELDEFSYKKSYIHILAALTKLRQVSNHPNLILKDENYQKYNSGKLEIFKNLIKELISEDRKILVFSQFTSMLDILENEIKKEKISYSRLDGQTKERQKIIDNFNQNKNIKIFLISLKAGGVGLNLTSADAVIIFDPWWNPSTENQAIDRSHRIGQKKSVNVYRLITKNSIEEQILNLQKEKKNLFDSLINKTESDFKKLEWSDIKNIFGL